MAHKLCAQQTASLLSEKPGGFFDSLKRPIGMAGGAFLPGEGGMCGALTSGRGADLRPKGLYVWAGQLFSASVFS